MMRNTVVAMVLACAFTTGAAAQSTSTTLTEKQIHGRQLFAQSCGICHLQASLNANTYGPPLNKASANANNEVMRIFIMEGSARMPAFKHYLKTADVDAIIDYVRTVPVPAATTAAR
jgi:mono/diheme cytochrome c family protein